MQLQTIARMAAFAGRAGGGGAYALVACLSRFKTQMVLLLFFVPDTRRLLCMCSINFNVDQSLLTFLKEQNLGNKKKSLCTKSNSLRCQFSV